MDCNVCCLQLNHVLEVMRNLTLLALFFIFMSSVTCLSVQHLNHLQTAAQQQAYLDELLKIESNLKQSILDFEVIASSVNNNVTAYEGLTTIQTQTLEYGISAEREAMSIMTSQLVLPLEKKTWDCAMLTPAEVDAINRQISEAQKNIAVLQQKVDAEPDCQRNNEILINIQFLNQYISHLAKQVSANCANTTTPIAPPVIKNVYVPNAKNQYFIYGAQGEQTYNSNVQNLLNQQYTKIQCPIEAPYPKDNTCVGCPQDKLHFYDLTQKVCLTCPNDYIFDIKTHKCQAKAFNSNGQATNFIGGAPVPQPGLDTCPIDKPFYNGVSCISCPEQSFFDYGSLICKICPVNTVFDLSTHLCIYKKYNSDTINSKNYCCGGLTLDPNAEVCPKERPFFNAKQCISCSLPAYFNIQTLTCSLCPQGQGFSLVQGRCIDNKFFQAYYISTITPQTQNYYGTPPAQVNQTYQNVTSCPADHPFFTGSSCIQCLLPSYFNFGVLKCQNCPPEFRFDTISHKCQKILTTQMNSNMVAVNNFIGTIPTFNSQLATCPSDQPFFNGISCIACSLPNYVDFSTMSCKTCNNGYAFNVQNRQCVVATPQFYTSMKASNIYYNGDFNNVISKIESLKTVNPNMQECPPETPYFDFQKNSCIKCPPEFPLFDIKYNRCIVCAGKSFYNIESRLCIENGQVSATVERMIMNTVGWV